MINSPKVLKSMAFSPEALLMRIEDQVNESIATKTALLATLPTKILETAQLMATRLAEGYKILTCGNGGSAGDAQHFSAELINRYEKERPSLAAIALSTDTSTLTAIANDYSFEEVFSKQIRAFGQKNDILLAISTSGNSANVVAAIHAAHNQAMTVIALTGKTGGKINALLRNSDILLNIPSQKTGRIQEGHLMVIHCLCDLIDTILYPDAEKALPVC